MLKHIFELDYVSEEMSPQGFQMSKQFIDIL